MLSQRDKEDFIQQLECVICGSHENLSSHKYSKTYSHKTGYRTTTYETKSILVPMCYDCKDKIMRRTKILVGIILLFIAWIIIFFVIPLVIDFNAGPVYLPYPPYTPNPFSTFKFLLPINILGIEVFIILFILTYTQSYNPRTAVKLDSSLYSKSTWIYSRKQGDWILYESWMKDVLTDRANYRKAHPKRFPQKGTTLYKLQITGSLLILLSILAPSAIMINGSSFSFDWLTGISLYLIPGGTIPIFFTETFTDRLLASGPYTFMSIGSLALGLFFVFMTTLLGFFAIRNTTYFKKTEVSIKKAEKHYLTISIFAVIFGVLLSIYGTLGVTIFTFLNIQFFMILFGALFIIIGYNKAKKTNFILESETYEISEVVPTIQKPPLVYQQAPVSSSERPSTISQGLKFCGHCGNKIPPGSMFCTNCGKKL